MGRSKEIDHAVGQYLEKIAVAMTDVPPDEKDSVLREVESHIYAALEKRAGDSATLADLETVLAEMAPPSSYGQTPCDVAPAGREKRPCPVTLMAGALERPRLCWTAAIGGLLVLLSLPISAILVSNAAAVYYPAVTNAGLSSPQHNPAAGERGIWFILSVACVGLVLPALATGFGLAAISRIRASKGRLIGMPLAVAVSLLYPIPILAYVLYTAFGAIAENLHSVGVLSTTAMRVFFAVYVCVILAIDALIIRGVWRWADRPRKDGEFA